jgi:hypothetical protein
VPQGMPTGAAVFAWIWLNREHESFMNCASVRIGRGSANDTLPDPKPRASESLTQSALQVKSAHRIDEVQGQRQTSKGHERPTSTYSVASPSKSETDREHRKRHSHHHYHMHAANKRNTLQKESKLLQHRAPQTCDWASAPRMETSYYTKDASCAANAKSMSLGSDNFEVSWGNACGVVKGDGEYPIRDIQCN